VRAADLEQLARRRRPLHQSTGVADGHRLVVHAVHEELRAAHARDSFVVRQAQADDLPHGQPRVASRGDVRRPGEPCLQHEPGRRRVQREVGGEAHAQALGGDDDPRRRHRPHPHEPVPGRPDVDVEPDFRRMATAVTVAAVVDRQDVESQLVPEPQRVHPVTEVGVGAVEIEQRERAAGRADLRRGRTRKPPRMQRDFVGRQKRDLRVGEPQVGRRRGERQLGLEEERLLARREGEDHDQVTESDREQQHEPDGHPTTSVRRSCALAGSVHRSQQWTSRPGYSSVSAARYAASCGR